MKKLFLITLFLIGQQTLNAQTYLPIPTDTATYRYRIYDYDYVSHIIDYILFFNGQDTVIGGTTYQRIMTRNFTQIVPSGGGADVISETASSGDIYYGAIRQAGNKVYTNFYGTEKLILDFTAGTGDSIPDYVGKVLITYIDTIQLNDGINRRRYHTTDTGYYIVEGVGTNRGLLPDLDDGRGEVVFYCFNSPTTNFTPDTTLPCTEIYALGSTEGVYNTKAPLQIQTYPNPAYDILHIDGLNTRATYIINDITGRQLATGALQQGSNSVSVTGLPQGIYILSVRCATQTVQIKVVKQ